MGNKNQTEQGTNLHVRGMKSTARSTQASTAGPTRPEHPCSSMALLPRGGSPPSTSAWEKPPSARNAKPLPPSAAEASAAIRSRERSARSRGLPRERPRQTSCCAGDKRTMRSSLVVRSKSFVRCGLQDQIFNVCTKILRANYFDTAEVQITSERMMSLENKKNDFLTHPRALC